MSIIKNPNNRYIKRKGILFFIFIILFLTPFILQLMIPNNFNSNNDDFHENNSNSFKLPKTSGTQINITTPENKTYYEPMSGYYPATFGFEFDEDETLPYGWTEGSMASPSYLKVVDQIDGHSKVLEFYDGGISGEQGRYLAYNTFDPIVTYGTVEFWLRGDNPTYIHTMSWFNSADEAIITINVYSDKIWYRDGTEDIELRDFPTDEWVHIRIDFECGTTEYMGLSEDTYSIYLNSEYYVTDNFGTTSDNLAYLRCHSRITYEQGQKYWIDALGYSWDPNYNIGDNIFESSLSGTYNFVNDDIDSVPNEWTDSSTGTCSVRVVDNYRNKLKILQLYNDDTGNALADQIFIAGPQTYGTIEFWINSGECYGIYNTFWNGGTSGTRVFGINFDDGNSFRYLTAGTDWTNMYNLITEFTWYRVRIDFECTTGEYQSLGQYKYNVFLYNEFQELLATQSNILFENIQPHVDTLRCALTTSWAYGYWDAFGYSWDPNYSIGKNIQMDLNVDFSTPIDVNLVDVEYSLDGQVNQEFHENFIIPRGSDGHHTLQIFGYDS